MIYRNHHIYSNSNLKIENNDVDNDNNNDSMPDNETIYYQESFDSIKDAYNKAKDFINNSINGILMNKEPIEFSQKPKISAVIPCYNCKNFILRAIRSIQNQNFSNFEIVFVDDFSNDTTLSYLQQLSKDDQRIRIIKNKKNMGLFYTRCLGTLSSKGKYIFPIDSDDMFLDKDVFSIISDIADKGNFDIVIFNSIRTKLSPNIFSARISKVFFEGSHKPNYVLFQPELGYYSLQPAHKYEGIYFMEVYIFAKCIKTKIYKNALNKLGEERYSRYMNTDEDLIANYILFNTAKIVKYVSKYGYLYIERKGSLSSSNWKVRAIPNLFCRLYVLDAIIEFSKDIPKHKDVIINYINSFFGDKNLNEALKSKEFNKLFNSCLNRIFYCKYISEEDKNEIKKRGKNITFINYHF